MAESVRIFGSDEYKALKGGGRGMTAQISQIQAATKQRPDLFIKKGKNVSNTELASGYSLTGGPGKTLVDTIEYRGNETYMGGTFNVYKDAPKEEEPDTGDDDAVDEGPTDTGDDDTVDEGPNYEDLINQTLASIPSISDITDAIAKQNEASEARIRAMNEENRRLYINDQRNRASEARTPNLQIRGAGETPATAGSQGFRRRANQFKIAPFQGISGALGVMGQVAQNKLVNI
tara:strand:+ start:42 stop:740 length:699 start_codon:yes stop_codon:yes gene_type:complete